MHLPFTKEQFLSIFRDYNTAIWPAQVIVYLLALLIVGVAFRRSKHAGVIISATLAGIWLFTGIAYHWLFFSQINKAALGFGAIFVIQAVLLLLYGLRQPRPQPQITLSAGGILGSMLVLYAAVIYPLLGRMFGHAYPQSPSFGVTPCPVTIFTFGVLLWMQPTMPGRLLILPTLWAIIGFTAASNLGIVEDIALPLSALIAIIWVAQSHRQARRIMPETPTPLPE